MKISALCLSACSLAFVASSAHAASISPFQLPWVNGPARDSVYRSSEHPNSVFVLEAFENFCPHCHNNAAAVDALYSKYQAESRVQVIDLDLDQDQSEVQAWIDQYHPAYPVINDKDGTVFSQFGGDNGIPQTVVVDCKGEITYHTEGEWDAQATADINAAVDAALAQSCN